MGDALETTSFSLNGISWLVVPGEEQEIRCAFGNKPKDERLLRVTPHRRVIWREGERRALVVKHFNHTGLWNLLKLILRGSPATLEWKSLHEARHRGLTVPRPIALGRGRGVLSREGLLVIEALDDTVDLEDYLFGPARLTGIQHREVIGRIANFIRQAHDLGIYHRDLHLGNILARDNGREIYLIDFHRVEFLRSLNPAMRWHNLAALNGGCTKASKTDKIHFLKTYFTVPSPLAFDFKSLAARLEREGRRHRSRIWRSRIKRCLSENREFMRVDFEGYSGVVRRDYGDKVTHGALRSARKLFTQSGGSLVKNSRTTTVGTLPLTAGTLYIKRYNFQGIGYALKDLFRSSRARRTWVAANALRMREISVGLPVAYLEQRRLGFLLESFVITEAVVGESLTTALLDMRFLEKRKLVRGLAQFVRRMHDRQVSHRDLKGANILVQRQLPDKFCFSIIDYDGVKIGRVFRRRQAKDLARLVRSLISCPAFTRTDLMRFLQSYLGEGERNKRRMWRNINRYV